MFYYMYDGTYWVFMTISQILNSMAQSEASEGTATTERLITAKVLSDTIDEKLVPLENNISTLNESTRGISQNVDVDTLTTGGRYLVNGADSLTSNAPFSGWQSIDVYQSNIDGYVTLTVQVATELGAGLTRKYRRRTYSGGGQYSAWTTWSS